MDAPYITYPFLHKSEIVSVSKYIFIFGFPKQIISNMEYTSVCENFAINDIYMILSQFIET